MSVIKDFKMDYFLLKNALKGHNLVLFGSFSLPIQDFFGVITLFKGTGLFCSKNIVLVSFCRVWVNRGKWSTFRGTSQKNKEDGVLVSFCRVWVNQGKWRKMEPLFFYKKLAFEFEPDWHAH